MSWCTCLAQQLQLVKSLTQGGWSPSVVSRGDACEHEDASSDNSAYAEHDQVKCAQALTQPLPLPVRLGRELLRLQRSTPHRRLQAAGRESAWDCCPAL